MNDKLAFVDIETTGLDFELCAIWEIAIITNNEELCFQVEIPKEAQIDPWVRENGLDRYKNPNARLHSREYAATLVEDRLKGKHIVGACPWFDSLRLQLLLSDFGLANNSYTPWHYHLIDVEAMMFQSYVDIGGQEPPIPWKSRELAEAIGAPTQDEDTVHEALADARWARDVYEWLIN